MVAISSKTLILALATLSNTSCSTVKEELIPDLRGEPWRTTRAGSTALSFQSGVASDYEVDSTVSFVGANFGEPVDLHGEMVPLFGFGDRVEVFPVDDLSLFLGREYRAFEPDLDEELITFGDAAQWEYFLGSRWFLPTRFLDSQRLRVFLQAKLAYIPKVEFEMTTTLPFDPPLDDAILRSPFSGGEYWSVGAGCGLAYELGRHWMVSLGFFYEWPLVKSEGRTGAELIQSTGNDFVDDIMRQLEFDVEIEPQGWIAFLNFSYVF